MQVATAADPAFGFGENWARFLSSLSDAQIEESTHAVRALVARDLLGKTFIDIGSGSGLSSLAARKLGARVHSFDYDPRSVACTQELRRRTFHKMRRGASTRALCSMSATWRASGNSMSSTPGACCTIPERCGSPSRTPAVWCARAVCSLSVSTITAAADAARRCGPG